MKKAIFYESPDISVMAMETDGTILSQSTTDPNVGMNDLTYENIQWN